MKVTSAVKSAALMLPLPVRLQDTCSDAALSITVSNRSKAVPVKGDTSVMSYVKVPGLGMDPLLTIPEPPTPPTL